MWRRTVLRTGACGLVGAMLLLAGCGDDDDAQSALCDAQSQLDADVNELKNLDLADVSINDLQDIVGNIGDDVTALKDAGSDELAPQVDAVSAALDDLGTTVSGLGSSASPSDAASAIEQSLDDLGDATSDLQTAATEAESC